MRDLSVLGDYLQMISFMLVDTLAARGNIALQVEQYKRENGNQPIFRAEIEKKRLNEIGKLAEDHGLDVDFVRSIFKQIMDHSCKEQMIQREMATTLGIPSQEEWYGILRANLLALTAKIAYSYDKLVGKSFATKSHRDFEKKVIKETVKSLNDKIFALDLGCATGSVAFYLSESFSQVVGIDISPDMIHAATNRKADSKKDYSHLSFVEGDIEGDLSFREGEISFVVMSMGTASDIPNLDKVLYEINKALKIGGKVVLSFYNANALFNRWEFIPWQASLMGRFDVVRDCYEVRLSPKEIYPIFAKLYKRDEVEKIMPEGMVIDKIFTHPTFESIFPDSLLQKETSVRKAIEEIDIQLSLGDLGAYLVVICEKVK